MLANSNDVLVLADGTKIGPDGKQIKEPKVLRPMPTFSEAQDKIARANRRLSDLPTLPAQMNTLNVVMMYSLWGLGDQDIALAINLTVEQVQHIKSNEIYSRVLDEMVKSVLAQDQDRIRAVINEHAVSAITKVGSLVDSEDDDIALRASRDILDRAGHRPADIIEIRNKMEQTLRIEYVKTDQTKSMPALDVPFQEIN